MRRIIIPELLDSDAGTPQEIQDSLADLGMINRHFGGLRAMTKLLREVAGNKHIKSLSFLDVGGGSGELMTLTSESLNKSGIELRPVVLDRVPGHMNGRYPAVAADALSLPFHDDSFDVVGSCLFLHHLDPEQVVKFVNQALRVARHAVVVNDLVRHRLHLGLAYAGFAVFRSRITRHDSIASVRRAYTVREIQGMLRQTDAAEITVRKFLPFRMGVIVWKRPHTI